LALSTQVNIYSVDTSAFYNEKELKIHNLLNKYYIYRKKQQMSQLKSKADVTSDFKMRIKIANRRIKYLKQRLYDTFSSNKYIRQLNPNAIRDNNIVSVFESTLTRTIGIESNETSTDIIIVQAYFFEIIEDIILYGFTLNGEKYICFTASAGQIRTKKTLFIKESIWNKYEKSLMCGLTVKEINKQGGANPNKYLAYLALCNSATDLWEDFNINKCIVVDDMELNIRGLVDFIDDKTYEIIRKEMDVPINFTDGCGIMLPRVSKKAMIVRLPWIKGLLVPFEFDKFLDNYNSKGKGTQYGMVTDIFGKKHDVLNDGIEIIFTKSQFKMYKYYASWKQYVESFTKYNCQAGKCNEEEDFFQNAKINYQMLQTLSDMTDEELEKITERTRRHILNIGNDRKTKLRLLGVTKANTKKNNLQQAIEIYPELLRDNYCKEILKSVKKSLVNDGRAGKLDLDCKYTFIAPDVYAFCEWLFLGIKNPEGLLGDKEVFCNLYADEIKLDCLRSPSLYREHAVRSNKTNEKNKEWFITNVLYTSCNDLMSKILQNDFDGDTSLVVADKTIVEAAERNMNDIVPLYYNMAKSGSKEINNRNIYEGLRNAYVGGNIGMISNDITKIWNSKNINLDVIKLQCMENNFVIDHAKTLYKPTRPKHIDKLIKEHTKAKPPHFFIYAKDKNKKNVAKINNSVVNRLENFIPNPKINFSSDGLGKIDYRMMMSRPDVLLDDYVIEWYKGLDVYEHFILNKTNEQKSQDYKRIYQGVRNEILSEIPDINYIVDVLVLYLYGVKKTSYKTTLWECFGDIIVKNLQTNLLYKNIYCEQCGDIIQKSDNKKNKYCEDCWKEKQRKWQRESMKKSRILKM